MKNEQKQKEKKYDTRTRIEGSRDRNWNTCNHQRHAAPCFWRERYLTRRPWLIPVTCQRQITIVFKKIKIQISHRNMHTYIYVYIHPDIHECQKKNAYKHTCMHACKHTHTPELFPCKKHSTRTLHDWNTLKNRRCWWRPRALVTFGGRPRLPRRRK